MLIFNGKKYFVPLFVSPNGEANALPRQVIEGSKFVGKNGVVETGTLPYYDYEDMQADVLKGENGQLYIRSIVDGASVIEDEVYSIVPLWQFGNADPIYVAKGNHFTSADGFGIEGQAEIYDYTPIEASHKDETDTHYVFMGRVSVISFMEDEVLLKVPKSNFGNAQPSQVLEGVPFTSENGVSEVGTMPKVAMATPTVNVDADDEESEIVIVSINDQETGYAEKPPAPQSPPFTQSFVKLRIDGNTAIMECGDASISRSVKTVERASTAITVSPDETNGRLQLTASNNQAEGYTDGGNKTATQWVSLSLPVPTIDANGNVNATGNVSAGGQTVSKTATLALGANTADNLTPNGAEVTADAGYYPNPVKKSVKTTGIASPTLNAIADDEESEIYVNTWVDQPSGYTNGGRSTIVGKAIKLKVEGNTAIMECGDAKIERTVGASIATCTLEITRSTSVSTGNTLITATTYDGSNFVPFNSTTSSGKVTIENVVCGSVVHIHTTNMASLYGWSYGQTNSRDSCGGSINIPNEAGNYTVEIGVLDD